MTINTVKAGVVQFNHKPGDKAYNLSVIEYDDQTQQFYNSYIVCEPDGSIHNHRKIHCFISEYLSSGDSYTVFDSTLGYRIGILTCYDNNIIENVRMTVLEGADILFAPHQTGGVQSRSPHAMGRIDRKLWDQREINQELIEQQFKGPKGP